MLFIRHILITTIFLLTSGPASGAQKYLPHSEAGHSLLTNFLPSDYNAEPQNWAIVEDDRGVIYVGNGSGILEYDGVTWKQISLPNRALARSLARDRSGRIWAGGNNELGYLTSDERGSTVFASLRDKIPEQYSDFLDVWTTCATDEGIYFTTRAAIFRWDGSTMKVWSPQTSYHMSFVVDGDFYVRQFGIGLMKMEPTATGEDLRLVPGGERFAETRIYIMLPFEEERILIGTREENLFLYDGHQARAFTTQADRLLTKGGIYQPGVVLPGGLFGLGTSSEGLIMIDSKGNLVEQVNREAGLQDNSVFFTYADHRANVWLGMDKGITRVEVGSHFTRYDALAGLPSAVSAMARYKGRLYVGDVSGLKRLDLPDKIFRSVRSPLLQVFSLLSMENELLAAGANEGVYHIVGDAVLPVRPSVSGDYRAICLQQSIRNPDVVLVGLMDGLALLRRTPEGWMDVGRIPDLGLDVWTIAEGSKGELWLGTQTGRLARILIPEMERGDGIALDQIEVAVYGQEAGLDEGTLRPFRIGNKMYFAGPGEIVYSFDEPVGRFIKDPFFQGATSGHILGNFQMREDSDGRVWIASTYGAPVIAHPQADGTYTFEVLRQFLRKRIIDIYPESDGIAWLMGENELIRYEVNNTQGDEAIFPPLIRQVRLDGNDILFGGTGKPSASEIDYRTGAIRFLYASPGNYVQPRFRTQLEGFDKEFSDWAFDTERTYTNLPPRDYRFKVEAEGGGQNYYQFTVLPPLYLKWWAIIGYGIAALMFPVGIIRWRTANLKRRQKELVHMVRSATNEIRIQKEEVETQRDQLTDSINYAQRIQTAVLPNKQYMDTIMPEYFVLFKPRDIVSGDFYWVKEVQDHLVIVGADCTGHGVPGAFMSILGITLLNDLIGDRCFNAPGAILEQLRLKIKELLVQENNVESQKDGMDMIVAILNKTTRELHYSGANSPMYLIRKKIQLGGNGPDSNEFFENGDFQLIELKGDKQPVGVHWEETSFTNHTIKLHERDSLYIFSDGFIDQFGGENRKKFKSVNFKKLLLSIQEESLENQKKLLDNAFESWRGKLEQIDDVFVVGVRV
jgi:serine phosphatase RsbU (regulator of sigma subunit)/ligand-binding sensor domain-containing protein